MVAATEPSPLEWALGVARDAADRGARFVLPSELTRGGPPTGEPIRMMLTAPVPAVGATAGPPPSSTALDAVTYLACWSVGGLLLLGHWRLSRDDPFARQLQGVLQTLRLVLRSSR